MTWAIAAFSLLGTVLNIHKRAACFAIWAATNSTWVVIDIAHDLPARAGLDSVYFGLSIWGWVAWKRGKHR